MTDRIAELHEQGRFLAIERTFSLLHHVVKWGALCVFAYFGTESVQALAGHTTAANLVFKFLANAPAASLAGVLFGAGGLTYGALERRRRKADAVRAHGRNKELERKIDPGRTSSELTPRGETKPEDL